MDIKKLNFCTIRNNSYAPIKELTTYLLKKNDEQSAWKHNDANFESKLGLFSMSFFGKITYDFEA